LIGAAQVNLQRAARRTDPTERIELSTPYHALCLVRSSNGCAEPVGMDRVYGAAHEHCDGTVCDIHVVLEVVIVTGFCDELRAVVEEVTRRATMRCVDDLANALAEDVVRVLSQQPSVVEHADESAESVVLVLARANGDRS